MSGLHFDFTGNPSGLVNAANQSRIAIQGITDEADKAGMKIDEFLGASKNFVASMTGIGIGVQGLKSFATALVDVRSEFQDTEAKLKVFLKSEQAAADMMEELEDLAWNNTFEFTDITKAAAQLLAFKTDAKDVGDTINRLSEIAAGTGASLGDMVDRFNKVKATGKMDSNMVQSFSAMGVDVKSVLAELEGKSRSDYEGVTLTFQDLQKVIHHLTDEGGMFFGMMKERGKNLSDSIAGVRDNFALMMNDMGKSVQGPVKAGIDAANELIANWREVAKAIGGAVVAFGSYKAAFATIEGIKAARQKINYQLEAQELQSVTKATQEAYKVEIEMLEQQIQAGTAARDADLQVAVAKGNLTEAQAAEIASLRELAAQQVNELALKAQLAQADAAQAALELKAIDNAANAKQYYEEELAAIEKKIAGLGAEATAEQRSALEKKRTIAQENLEIATRKANEAQTRRQAVAERAEAAAKNAEGLAAQADAARQGMDSVGKAVNTTQTKLLTRAQAALGAVMEATGLSMLANPYVLAAVAIAALCYGIYKLCTAESAAEKATRRHNEEMERQKQLMDQVNSVNSENVSTLQNKNATDQQKTAAFRSLREGKTEFKDDEGNAYDEETQKIMNSAGQKLAEFYGTADALAAASRDEVDKLMNEFADQTKLDLAIQSVNKAQEEVARTQAYIDAMNASVQYGGQGATYWDYKSLEEATEYLQLQEKALKDIQKTIDDTNWSKLSLDEKKLDYEQNLAPQIDDLNQQLAEQMKKVEEIGNPRWWNHKAKVDKKEAEAKIEEIKAELASIEDKRVQITVEENNLTEDTSTNTAATRQQIRQAEKDVAAARAQYAKNASDANKEALTKAESALTALTNRYKNQTGKSWSDSVQMAEERMKQIEKLAREETKIQNSQIKEQRASRKAAYELTIQEIQAEEKEYKRTHNGRGSGTLDKKLSNAKLQFELDMKDLDRQWNEWKRNHERETIHLQMDIEMEALQRDLENATTAAERNAATAAIRTAEDNRMKSENREKADDEIKSKLGGSLESLEAYTQNKGKSDAELADILGIDAETVTQLRQIEEHYANILTLQQAQKAGQRGQEDLHQQVSDLESYMKTATQLTSDYENTLENIRAKYNIREDVDMHTAALPAAAAQERDLAKSILDQQMAKNGQDNGIVDAEGDIGQLIQQINDITVNVAAKTTEEIVTLYQQVLDELNGELEELNTQISADKTTLETGQELNEETGLMEDITPERRLEIEQEMNQLIAERQVLTQMQSDVQAKANEAASQSLTAQQKRMQQFDTTSDHLINGFASLNQSAKTISATFGGALSKKGKKAMQAIEGISDAAGNALSGLKTMIPAILTLFTSVGSTGTAIQTEEAAVSTGTSAAITGTSTAAATAIRTVETASVILAVISAALQIIQAIVNVVMQFNEAQQMQDAIDEDIERVEALKREQEQLNKAFEREAGTAYYKGMSKAAKNYYNLILAQEKAVADARKLYERQAEKYGEDSDKAKDAKKQYEEQLDALEEFKDEQQEMFDEMAQDLLTTDLSSFAENLADQYIEGFEQGMDGINGVFDSVMNDLQKNMMKKGLSIALENLFKDTWDRIKAMTEDGDLTTSEMDAIMAEMDAKAAQSKQIAEQYYNAMSERGLLGDGDVETSSGGFDAMTQDQADTLSARFTALQIEGANVVTATQAMMTIMEQLGINDAIKTSTLNQMMTQFTLANEIALNQLDELRKITENTSTLADTNRRLRAIEDNTNSLRE